MGGEGVYDVLTFEKSRGAKNRTHCMLCDCMSCHMSLTVCHVTPDHFGLQSYIFTF